MTTALAAIAAADWRRRRRFNGSYAAKARRLYVAPPTYEGFLDDESLRFHRIVDPKLSNKPLDCWRAAWCNSTSRGTSYCTSSPREPVPTDKCIMWPINTKKGFPLEFWEICLLRIVQNITSCERKTFCATYRKCFFSLGVFSNQFVQLKVDGNTTTSC